MENNINILRTRRMILEYKFLTTELEEVSLQSKEYVTKFLNDLIPDDINIFDNDEKENPEEEEKTEEEIELDEISSEILNKLHKKITLRTHPDRCDEPELNELFIKTTKAYKEKNLPLIMEIAEILNIKVPTLKQPEIKIVNLNCRIIRSKIGDIRQQVAWKWCNASSEEEKNRIKKWVKNILITKVLTLFKYDSEDFDEKCSICLEIFRDGMNIAELRCNHKFHENCINKWFDVNFTCPLCKQI